jgi:hypothetical protein
MLFEKTKPNCQPAAGNSKSEARNPKLMDSGKKCKTKPILAQALL